MWSKSQRSEGREKRRTVLVCVEQAQEGACPTCDAEVVAVLATDEADQVDGVRQATLGQDTRAKGYRQGQTYGGGCLSREPIWS